MLPRPPPSLPPPRLKKKKTYINRHLPPSSKSGLSTDFKCSGTLHGGSVIVRSVPEIKKLIQNGCFGKGIFSRSVPTHGQLPRQPDMMGEKRRYQQEEEQLEQFEHAQEKRMKIHSLWNEERVKYPVLGVSGQSSDSKATAVVMSTSEQVNVSGLSQVTSEDVTSGGPISEAAVASVDDGALPAETSIAEQYHLFVQRIKALSETDPYKVTEYLQLSHEEVIYLAYELKILDVYSPEGNQCNPADLWALFCGSDTDHFVVRYVTYLYFRRQGWVPRSGLKFGVDFLLYKDSPVLYHSSYAVVIRLVEERESGSLAAERDMTWQEVIALCRVNESAVKDVLVCFVTKPANIQTEDLKTPSCVSEFTIQEVLVSRWIPDRE